MNREPPLPDPRDLEARLARRPVPAPGDDLRARVLAAWAATPAPAAPGRWTRVAFVAAAVVLVLNLAMCIANGLHYQRLDNLGAQDVPRSPAEASPSEDRFDRLAADALSTMSPSPDAGALGRNAFLREDWTWDTR